MFENNKKTIKKMLENNQNARKKKDKMLEVHESVPNVGQ